MSKSGNRSTIISCAVTGSHTTREHNENLPVTPEEIADACIGAAQAGAAICHIHVRDPESGKPSMVLDYYQQVVERIRNDKTDLIINLTTGPGGRFVPSDDEPAVAGPGTVLTTPQIRTEHVVQLRPEICSLDLNTMWFGQAAVINSPRNIKIMAQRIYDAGVKPELEVFDSGDIQLAHELLADGTLRDPTLFQIVTGVKYGFTATTETLHYARDLLPNGCTWAAFGASRMAFPMVAQAWLLGGHCRVGMEDTVYLSRGVKTPDNAALVTKAAGIISDLGGSIAGVDEARDLLGLVRP